jgi:hypothetical protein
VHERSNHELPINNESTETQLTFSNNTKQPNFANCGLNFDKKVPSLIEPKTTPDIESRIRFRQETAARRHVCQQISSRSTASKASAGRKAENVVDILERVRIREEIAIQKHVSLIRANRSQCKKAGQGIKLPKIKSSKVNDIETANELSQSSK